MKHHTNNKNTTHPILVVDDELDTREILSAAFENIGFPVVLAHNGEEALNFLQSGELPALMVLDMMMPGIDGIEVCKQVRKHISSTQMPIIVATAFDETERRLEFLSAGADDYITKPFEPMEVVARANIQLAIRKALTDSEWRRQSLEVLFEAVPIGLVLVGSAHGQKNHSHIASSTPLLNSIARDILSLNDSVPDEIIITEAMGFSPISRACDGEGPSTEDRNYDGGWYRVDSRCISSEDGGIGALVIFRDVTRELEMDELKTEFAQVVSHELRTPLTAINNSVDLLCSDEDMERNTQQQLSKIIRRNTKRMLKMVQDLLDLSKLQAGRTELTLIEGSIERLTESVTTSLTELAAQRGIKFNLIIEEDIPESLFIDVSALERVLANLLSNAIKYTRENTTVTISASMTDGSIEESSPRAKLLATFAKGFFKVSVADSGVGVPHAEKERIFDKFVRIERQAHSGSQGTGLGLSIAQQLVKAHGGNLFVESNPGHGATFIFKVPVFDRYGALGISIADKLYEAKQDRRSLGIVVIRLGQRADIYETWEFAGDLSKIARDVMFRAHDFAVFNPHLGELVLLLEGCIPDLLPQVGGRVAKELRKHFMEKFPERDIAISSGHSYSSPQQSLDQAVILMDSARKKAANETLQPRKILVVDDDPAFLEGARKILGLYDFDPICMSDASKALTHICQDPPALIIVDVRMPENDGYWLCLEVRSRPALRDIPIFFVSGCDEDARSRVFSTGGNEFIKKPIDAEHLIKLLKLYVG